jgi:hypothetical protein
MQSINIEISSLVHHRRPHMNLELAEVVSISIDGCDVRPVDGRRPYSTRYSNNIVLYNIPIRPSQFVVVDLDPTPPETIFRFSRARVTQVTDCDLTLEFEGNHFAVAERVAYFDTLPEVGDEVILVGWNDENRRLVDLIIDGKPAHPEQLAANWFPAMDRFR